ncbi:hypothetical protein HDU96_001570 [Phlyctochytrium bullatum]|nr:hypothetical protein HDU96_001570 [Phlyctochytrium bullatum]
MFSNINNPEAGTQHRAEPQPPSPTPKIIFASSSSEKPKVPIAPARGQSFVRTASPLDISGVRAEREARSRVGLLSAAEVGERLLRLGIGAALVSALEENNIDGPNVLTLTDSDLVGMGIQERYSRELILRAITYVVAVILERDGEQKLTPIGEDPEGYSTFTYTYVTEREIQENGYWDVVPELDVIKTRKFLKTTEMATWDFEAHYIHACCFGYISAIYSQRNIPISRFIAAVCKGNLNPHVAKPPHDEDFGTRCDQYWSPIVRDLRYVARFDRLDFNRVLDPPSGLTFEDCPRPTWTQRPTQEFLDKDLRDATQEDPAAVWRFWMQGTYWFLAWRKPKITAPGLHGYAPAVGYRPSSAPAAAQAPVTLRLLTHSDLLDLLFVHLEPEDLKKIEALSRDHFHLRNALWRKFCARDGFACVPGKEREAIEELESKGANFKAVYWCRNSRRKRFLKQYVEWSIERLDVKDSCGNPDVFVKRPHPNAAAGGRVAEPWSPVEKAGKTEGEVVEAAVGWEAVMELVSTLVVSLAVVMYLLPGSSERLFDD